MIRAEPAVPADAVLGEGPVWDAKSEQLIWLDLLGNRLYRSDVTTGQSGSVSLDRTVGAVALDDDGRLIAATTEGFADLSEDGTLTVFCEVEADRPGNRMNDGECAPDGSFWAGTVALDNAPGAGTLYRLDRDGTAQVLLSDLTVSNGLAWSPDGAQCYFTDTATGRVDILTRAEDGSLSRRPFVTIDPERGSPDGLTVDAEGNLWVAMCFGGQVICFDASGRERDVVNVPCRITTSVAFGGPDLETLYITTGRATLSEADLGEQPASGSVFACQPGTSGQLPYRYLR